ncbi:hypothetical protein BGZ52_007422 [Haplosporangium bisporale]|nr:hypothetical protein BGZ52_007422 [Haplosporangium bisporale]
MTEVNQHQNHTFQNSLPKVALTAQQTAFAIPELRSHIAIFLNTKDISNLTRTCRNCHRIWLTELFTVVSLHRPPPAHFLALLETYGHHVRKLALEFPHCEADFLKILQLTPNTCTLELYRASFSKSKMEEIVSSAPANLRGITMTLEQEESDSIRDELFPLLAHFGHLRSIFWVGSSCSYKRSIHDDDIARVMEACPQLTALHLGCVNLLSSEPEPFLEEEASEALPTDIETTRLCAGRRLRALSLSSCTVSDESLLRLLGISSVDRGVFAQAHPLVRLNLDLNHMQTNAVTSRSITRILQECHSLEALMLSNTKVVPARLFQDGQEWPCAQSLRRLHLDIKTHEYLELMSDRDQELMRDRLRSLTKLESLYFVGYPLGFAALEDVSLAQSLERADLTLEVGAPWDYFEGFTGAHMLAQGNAWLKSQLPRRWGCTIRAGPRTHYHFTYWHDQAPKSDVAVLL